jgi:hypothetical protein
MRPEGGGFGETPRPARDSLQLSSRLSAPKMKIDRRETQEDPKTANFLLSIHLHRAQQSRKIHRLAPHNRTFTINRLIYGVSVDFIREENPPRRDKRSFFGHFIGRVGADAEPRAKP